MRQPLTDEQLRKNLRRTSNTPTDATQTFLNRQIASEWLDIEKHIAWHGGYVLNQVVCKRNEEGWLLIVKAHRNGRAYAAFLQTGTLAEAYELGGEFASRGVFTWQDDRWPSKWLKRQLKLK